MFAFNFVLTGSYQMLNVRLYFFIPTQLYVYKKVGSIFVGILRETLERWEANEFRAKGIKVRKSMQEKFKRESEENFPYKKFEMWIGLDWNGRYKESSLICISLCVFTDFDVVIFSDYYSSYL